MTPCWLCSGNTTTKNVHLRSGKESIIRCCSDCDFEFFDYDNRRLLSENQLDKTRLESAGLDIPQIGVDFQNGYEQSQEYLSQFITKNDIGTNVLEIGCSWGYFLKLLQEYGCYPLGLEINSVRARYVRDTLKIRCEEHIGEIINSKIKYKKIFLFYCLEYIMDPVLYIKKLIDILEPNGKIILITPNLNDILKNIWKNEGYLNFFYDECAVSYYSYSAINQLMRTVSQDVNTLKYQIDTEQGYSIFNHLQWYFNKKPLNGNKRVGGDVILKEISEKLNRKDSGTAEKICELLHKIDVEYKDVANKKHAGNRIICILQKDGDHNECQ